MHCNFLCSQSSCGNQPWEGTFAILLQKGTVSEHVTRIELSVNTRHFEVSLLQFLLQPTMPDIQMFHSSDTSLVAKCSGNIGVGVQDNRKKPQPTELQIVLHQFGFFQNFAHAHDFTFTTAERVLSSRPAVAVQSEGGNYSPKPQTSLGFGVGGRRGRVTTSPNPLSLKPVSAAACPFLESHCRLTQLWLVKRTSLRKMLDYQPPVLKVSLVLKNENWMKNLLTSLEPRSERSSPYYIVSEYRF